nr:glycosyltransferase [Bacteroidota bacterium]
MKISIVVPTYNNEEYTIRCMNSIRKHSDDYVILWIDDGSSRESVEQVQQFLDNESIPYELLAKDKNSGFAKSVNLGLARALELGSDYVVIQNNDTEVYADWLVRMI